MGGQYDVCLRRALLNNEFLLHYQPKVSLTTGEIVGVEALIRWQQPGHALAMPSQCTEIAEECGLIVPIGRWVRFATGVLLKGYKRYLRKPAWNAIPRT